MPNGDQFFFLVSRDSTRILIVDVYLSGGNKEHETTQFLYKKDPPMVVVVVRWCGQESVLIIQSGTLTAVKIRLFF